MEVRFINVVWKGARDSERQSSSSSPTTEPAQAGVPALPAHVRFVQTRSDTALQLPYYDLLRDSLTRPLATRRSVFEVPVGASEWLAGFPASGAYEHLLPAHIPIPK